MYCRTSLHVHSVVETAGLACGGNLHGLEFLPMLQPSTDALPHLILIKAPKGTSYNSTRRGCDRTASKCQSQDRDSVPPQTKALVCFFPQFTGACETGAGISVLSSIVTLSESPCGCGHPCLSSLCSSSLAGTQMTVCDSIPPR